MKKRLLSILLVMVLVVSLIPAAMAADSDPVFVDQKTSDTDDGALHMKKTLLRNEDGTYDIRIESWATGQVDSHEVTEAVPTDFVLVLDQSGSMTTEDIPASYELAGQSWTPNQILNGSYYYNVPGTNNYYPVYCKDKPTTGVTKLSTNPRGRDLGTSDGAVSYNGEALYFKDSDGAVYRVYQDVFNFLGYHNATYYYIDGNGIRHDFETRSWLLLGLLTSRRLSSDLYTVRQHAYGLYYTDENGVEHQIDGSTTVTGVNTVFFNGPLYVKGEIQSRLNALKKAVTNFVDTVQSKAEEDQVNHRVAIVGFASDDTDTNNNNPAWQNTELLTGVNVSGTTGRQYTNISNEDYQNALQDVTTTAGQTDLKNAIKAIDAAGGTQAQHGFTMAENILEKRQVKTYVNSTDQTMNRNTVVLFFTDGHPGNYDSSDQITAANAVVTAANKVKQNEWKTKVFSVGIFATGDDQPLTFTLPYTNQNTDAMERDNYVRATNSYLFFRGNKVTQTPYNDTIAEYMRCVSSIYPNAENFLTHAGGTADEGSKANKRNAENQDQVDYYMRVTDSDGLKRAFEVVASIIDTSTTSSTVDGSAVLRDKVYTGDFDVSGASVEAKSVKVKTVGTEVVETGVAGTAEPKLTETVASNGRLSVTDFNYSALYTDSTREGEKLVVTISNLIPKQGGHLWSNSGDASIFPNDSSSDAVLGVASPEENIARTGKVIDYNYPVQLTTDLGNDSVMINGGAFTPNGKSGTYAKSGTTLTYQLSTEALSSTDNLREGSTELTNKYNVDIRAYNGVDKALFFETGKVWTEVATVPANNVYYDDAILNTPVAASTIEGTGYNAGMTSSSADEFGGKMVYYTFKGTGIDVYSTTTDKSKLVTAEILDASGNVVTNLKGEKCSMAMRNYSKSTRLNVPSVFFRDLEYGTYILTVYASANAKYNIDGIRVYNPAGTDKEANDLYAADDLREQNATFENFRKMLIANGTDLINEEGARLNGVGFYLDNGTENATLSDYTVNGPKNEIYLAENTGIAFKIANWTELQTTCGTGIKLMVGLSVPDDDDDGDGSVKLSNMVEGEATYTPVPVESPVDMYYEVKPNAEGIVVIFNSGDNMVSLTNLKISGGTSPITASFAPTNAEPLAVNEEEAAVTMNLVVDQSTMDFASRFATLRSTAEVNAEHEREAQSLADMIRQLISNFVQQLFSNIAKLFGK